MPIRVVTEERCSSTLIEQKDRLHRVWFQLQSYPVKQKSMGRTFFYKPVMDEFITQATEAVEDAKQCAPEKRETQALTDTFEKLRAKVQLAQSIKRLGDEVYEMDSDIATDIIINDINRLINHVHNIGSSFIEYDGRHGGCKLLSSEGARSVNSGALSYCEGVAHQNGQLRKGGTEVEHRMGVHHNLITFEEDEDGYNIKMKYTESGADNWMERQDEVIDKLKSHFNVQCDAAGLSAECEGKLRNSDRLRGMAYFMSSVRDVDLLHYDCIGRAVDYAVDEAIEAVKQKGPETYQRSPYPDGLNSWNKEICPESEEAQKRRRINRAVESTEYYKSEIDGEIEKAKSMRCSRTPYVWLRNAMNDEKLLENNCDELSGLDADWQANDCRGDLINATEKIDEACIELVERCPPKPIMDVLEADLTGIMLESTLKAFNVVCGRAEDEQCLKDLSNAITRDIAGIKQLKLPEGEE